MGDLAKEVLIIAKVFAAAIAGFVVIGAFFGAPQIDAIIIAVLILTNILLATLIALITMLILILIGGRFFRLF